MKLTLQGEFTVSDGYHTFDELYEHRIRLFITLCFAIRFHREVWVSIKHFDGSTFGDWFVMGINKNPGSQITYHLPARFWTEVCEFAEVLDCAPQFDGHTPEDVLIRLEDLF